MENLYTRTFWLYLIHQGLLAMILPRIMAATMTYDAWKISKDVYKGLRKSNIYQTSNCRERIGYIINARR